MDFFLPRFIRLLSLRPAEHFFLTVGMRERHEHCTQRTHTPVVAGEKQKTLPLRRPTRSPSPAPQPRAGVWLTHSRGHQLLFRMCRHLRILTDPKT